MNISRSLLIILFFIAFAETGCSAQPVYVFRADLVNVCNSPIQITLENYTNSKEFPHRVQQHLNHGEALKILMMISNSQKIDAAIKRSYSLEITADGNKSSINHTQLSALLTEMHKKNTSMNYPFFWTIKDPTLCPKPQDATQ